MIRSTIKRVLRRALGRPRPAPQAATPRPRPEAPTPATPAPEAPAPKPTSQIRVTPEETPNPNAMKLTLSQPPGSFNFSSAEDAADHPLASAMFTVDGVVSLFATGDFVTVMKEHDADWDDLLGPLTQVIQDELGS